MLVATILCLIQYYGCLSPRTPVFAVVFVCSRRDAAAHHRCCRCQLEVVLLLALILLLLIVVMVLVKVVYL